MREIITINVGQCGNAIGANYWEQLCSEHGIDPRTSLYNGDSDEQLQHIEVCFNEHSDSSYAPRAILVDLDTTAIDQIRCSPSSQLYQPDNIVCGSGSGTASNWAKGFYVEGRDLIETIMDAIRKESEQADRVQAYQMYHSIGGGTGSGLGSLILQRILEDYGHNYTNAFTVFPSLQHAESVVEPYNSTLTVHQLVESVGGTFVMDNNALYNICHNQKRI